jgi:ubiquinone/menaquinone biosynthesis C-methylase UbiE
VRRAAARAAQAGIKARFVDGSALDLPFADGTFDAVLSVASIKHWPDPARGLAECARVLRAGGHLLVIEADRGCRLDDARRFVDGWRVPRAARRLLLPLFRTYVAGQAFDLDEARGLLAGAALDEARVERLEGLPALVLRGRKPG